MYQSEISFEVFKEKVSKSENVVIDYRTSDEILEDTKKQFEKLFSERGLSEII